MRDADRMYDRPLRVFVSSGMQELARERQAIKVALQTLKVDAWVYEDDAGARSQSIQQTYLDELAAADLYVGVFWNRYGHYTADELHHALHWNKACLVYEKYVDIAARDPQLQALLNELGAVETGLSPSRFQTAEDLAEQIKVDIARWQTMWVRRGLSQAIGEERERLSTSLAARQAMPRQRVVNLPPQGLAELFKDRTAEMAAVLEALLSPDNGVRLVTVFGQGGIGKTALACHAMRQIEKADGIDGVVYLSARTTGLTFERIYSDSARMLGGAAEEKLTATWKSEATTTPAKIQTLLEAYNGGRYVLLLDNVESVLEDSGRLADGALEQFLNAFLAQPHGARLFATTREPLSLPADIRKHQRLVPLEQGLPAADAVQHLRDLDRTQTNGRLGLLDAPEALLTLAAEKTHGYPTALEAIVSILSEDGLSLDALLADHALFGEGVISSLVRSALSRLDADGHRVMQALAVFGRPVREVAVSFLLEPYADAAAIPALVRRLTRALYVNSRRATGELILHPLYREFSYAALPAGDDVAYSRTALERRAAAYYAQLRLPPAEWKSIRNLDPQIFEFEHSLRAGDAAAANHVLSGIDVDYLIPWGHARLVAELRGRLPIEKLPPAARATHHLALAEAALAIGSHADAMRQAQTAAQHADGADQPAIRARADIVSGSAAWSLGDYRAQEDHCLRALTWSREAGDPAIEIRARCGLAEAYRCLGRMPDAVDHARQAVALAADTGRRSDEARAQRALGSAYRVLGELDAARACFEAAMTIATECGDALAACQDHNHLALVLLAASRPATSLLHARDGLALAREIGSIEQEAYAITYAGCALLAGGRYDEARRQFEEGLNRFETSGYRYGVSFVLAFLGSACIGLGDVRRAHEFLERGLAIATALGEPRSAGYLQLQLARAYAAGGAFDRAVLAARSAAERFRAAGTPHHDACDAYAEALHLHAEGQHEAEAAALLQAAQGLLRGGDFANEALQLARAAAAILASAGESPVRREASTLAAGLAEQLALPSDAGQVL